MGTVGTTGGQKTTRRRVKASRRNALRDALPDVQPPDALKQIDEIGEVAAETDEDDD